MELPCGKQKLPSNSAWAKAKDHLVRTPRQRSSDTGWLGSIGQLGLLPLAQRNVRNVRGKTTRRNKTAIDKKLSTIGIKNLNERTKVVLWKSK
jgi:hypothetical protein